MPQVQLFADFDLDDDVALERFLDANDRKHQVYVHRTNTRGGTLRGPVNGDWFLRETSRHVSLARFARIKLSSADTKVLMLPKKWQTQQQLIDWMDLHSRLHLVLDRVLQVHG